MKGYLIYSSGKYYKFNTDEEKPKLKKVSFVLLEVKSFLFGKAYVRLSSPVFQRLLEFSDITFSYRFLDGCLADNCDDDDLYVKHKYFYENTAELFAKLKEIVISEDVLNDSFWVHDCFYSYSFTDIKVKYKDKDGNIHRYTNFMNFWKDIKYHDRDDHINQNLKNFIYFGKKKCRETNKHGDLHGTVFVKYNREDLYFKVEKKFFKKYKSIDIETKLQVCDYDANGKIIEVYDEGVMDWDYHRKDGPFNLFKARFGPDVINQLESSNDVYQFRLRNKVYKVNGEKVKKFDFVDFMHKYFHDIPGRKENNNGD